MKALRLVWGVTVCVLALLLLFSGGLEVWRWQKLRTGQYLGIKWDSVDHLWLGVRLVALGAAGYVAYGYGTLRRHASIIWRSLGMTLISVGLLSLLVSELLFPRQMLLLTYLDASVTTGVIEEVLRVWHREHGRYPASEQELRGAVGDLDLESPYVRRGHTVPYRLVYVAGASGPVFSSGRPTEPGVIYCAISPDMHSFWLTTTVLKKPVGTSVTWLRRPDKEPKPAAPNETLLVD